MTLERPQFETIGDVELEFLQDVIFGRDALAAQILRDREYHLKDQPESD